MGQTITVLVNTQPRGPEGKSAYQSYLDTTDDDPVLTEEEWSAATEGGGGVTTFAELTDKATADLPAINTPLATALSGKASLAGNNTFTAQQEFSDSATWLYTAASKANHRSSLGAGATGDALFTATNADEARAALSVVRKITTADVSRNNAGTGTTFTNDPTLQLFAVEANSWYLVEFALLFTCTINSGIKTQLLHPALATAAAFSGRVFSSSTPTDAVSNTSTVTTLHSVTAARTIAPISGYCRIRIGSSGGNIALQWAQNVSSTDNTTLLAGSLMTVTKI